MNEVLLSYIIALGFVGAWVILLMLAIYIYNKLFKDKEEEKKDES